MFEGVWVGGWAEGGEGIGVMFEGGWVGEWRRGEGMTHCKCLRGLVGGWRGGVMGVIFEGVGGWAEDGGKE